MSVRPPPRERGRSGAGLWVLLAIGLNVAATFFSPSDSITTLDWVFAAATTVAWVLGAVNARSGLARVFLWLIVIGQAIFWVFALGLAGSSSLPTNLAVGDCFDDPDSSDVLTVETVSCDQPHDNEVFMLGTAEDAFGTEFPGVSVLGVFVFGECLESFESYVGSSFDESALDLSAIVPSPERWEEGGRSFTCFLFRVDLRKLNGSARNSGL